MISNHAEGTLGRLRYFLGGDRPSQTTRLTLSSEPVRSELEQPQHQSSIPTTAPLEPRSQHQSVLPILCKYRRCSILSYSKAPWGLSVQSRVTCIFTGIKISPSLLSRQRPDYYTIRARQNLPDKEFRYLRTVIVTAAVHWGFNLELALHLLTFQHWAGITPYTSPCGLAQSCVFGKQLPGPLHCDSLARALLLANLRSNFAEFLNNSYLAHLRLLILTTCVRSRYGPHILKLEAFLESQYHQLRYQARGPFTPHNVFPLKCADLPTHKVPRLVRNPITGMINCLCHSITYMRVQEYQPDVHRLRLSASSQVPTNPGRTTLPQETLVNWWMGVSPIIVTYTGILTSMRSTTPFGIASPPMERSPTTLDKSKIRNFGIMLQPR